MKKRSLLVTLLLVLTMLVTACGGSTNPFEGKWKGTCDLTDYIVDSMVAGDPTLEEYVDFEELSFVINFTFEGDEISMSVDDDSIDTFVANAEDGIRNMLDKYMRAQLEGTGIDVEFLASANGYDSYDALLDGMVSEMGLSAMIDPLTEALELEGTYEYDEEDGILTVTYEDGSEEEMKFEFDGDDLTITVSDGADEFDIKCEKQ